MSEGCFENKVALVTGGATGIGRATALQYAQEGARVVIADINDEEAVETIRLIEEQGGEALFVHTDVTAAGDVQRLVERVMERFGRLDAAFNNAGTLGHLTNVVDCTEDEWDMVVDLNLKSVWLCMKYEIPAMLESGGGAIVNTASVAANQPTPLMASYIATKAGVVGLTRSAAIDFADRNIRVNALLPGPTVTPMLTQAGAGLGISVEDFAEALPVGRLGQPQDQADAVIWLTSQRSSFVTGQALSVDGGANLR